MTRVLLVVIWLLIGAGASFAHSSSRSSSIWTEDDKTINMAFSIDQVQATLLVPLDYNAASLQSLLAGHLAASISVTQGDAPCAASIPYNRPTSGQRLHVQINFTCKYTISENSWNIENNAFFDFASTHIHIAYLKTKQNSIEIIFTDRKRNKVMRLTDSSNVAPPAIWVNFITYVHLGLLHILGGIDHLIFVTALVLLAKRPKQIAVLVTGFTIGHSITLGLASLGVIIPFEPAIEALIGFSIAFVAVEILVPANSRNWKPVIIGSTILMLLLGFAGWLKISIIPASIWLGLALFIACYGMLVTSAKQVRSASIMLTAAFGLVHGAGFASVLQATGLPHNRQVSALFGFNVGVEIGQLLVVILWVILLKLTAKVLSQASVSKIEIILAGIILASGIFWMIDRSFI
ncbi:HupE/UreJ family protein [Oceanicaulis sp. AH-315-P02]|nr:HupE/UreJ family protein [Robiginitomaculum sp.]MBN4047876.1 HupE/UreJ family protein [Oceanicaulis sp. AH-315-P02]